MQRIQRRIGGWVCLALLTAVVFCGQAFAWDEEGHVIVTRIAIQSLPTSLPAWLRTPEVQARLEYLCAEPDRWRGIDSVQLDHANNPDHYMDLEMLTEVGLSLNTMPQLRRQFTDTLAEHRCKHPEFEKDYDPAKDKVYTRRVPGLLPYSIEEAYWKAASSWCTLRTMEKHRDKVTEAMLRSARENVVYHMGILSHYVGDGSQPLHLTVHHNGWVGDNPKKYTKSKRFHSYIDGGVLVRHGFNRDALPGPARSPVRIPVGDDWGVIGQYLTATHDQVEPLYALQKSGELQKAAGKAFIGDRLLDGAAMLSGLWISAYEMPTNDSYLNNKLSGKLPISTSMPTDDEPESKPAPTTAPAK